MDVPTLVFANDRADALEQWRRWLPGAARYGETRNYVIEGHPNVTRLSPAIRHRLILGDELIEEVLAHHGWRASEKLIQEICWRDYWKGWLEGHPEIWREFGREAERLKATASPELAAEMEALRTGRSGVAVMDHFARELVREGYLHNHARMWWASFWVHVRRLPWQLGAAFFHEHLLDADAASNTLSWRWVAGLQTPGKSYLVRRSNLERFCGEAWLGDRAGMAELEDGRVEPTVAEEVGTSAPFRLRELETAPPASFSSLRVGLLLHEDDLGFESSPWRGLRPVSVLGLTSACATMSEKRCAFGQAAVADGVERAKSFGGCPGQVALGQDWGAAIDQWVLEDRLEAVATLAPFVGDVRDRLETVRQRVESRGVRWSELRRPADEAKFRHAGRGFFPYWKRVREELMKR